MERMTGRKGYSGNWPNWKVFKKRAVVPLIFEVDLYIFFLSLVSLKLSLSPYILQFNNDTHNNTPTVQVA